MERSTAKIDKILSDARDAQMEADQLAEEAEHLMMDIDLDGDDSSPHYVENAALCVLPFVLFSWCLGFRTDALRLNASFEHTIDRLVRCSVGTPWRHLVLEPVRK